MSNWDKPPNTCVVWNNSPILNAGITEDGVFVELPMGAPGKEVTVSVYSGNIKYSQSAIFTYDGKIENSGKSREKVE